MKMIELLTLYLSEYKIRSRILVSLWLVLSVLLFHDLHV